MSRLQVPPDLYQQATARMPEIERAYSRFVVTELPAGYEGEIAEAYNNLLLAGMETTPDNILLYLKAKASLMEYLRADGASLTEVYRTRMEKPSVAGAILPEWILSLKILLGMLVQGLTAVYLLKRIFGRNVSPKMISQHARFILNIRDVKQLNLVAEGIAGSKRRKSSRKTVSVE